MVAPILHNRLGIRRPASARLGSSGVGIVEPAGNTYTAPGGIPEGARAIAAAIQDFGNGFVNVAQNVKRANKEDESASFETGRRLKYQMEQLGVRPDSPEAVDIARRIGGGSQALKLGVEDMDGELKASKASAELKQWANENQHLPDAEFTSGLSAKQIKLFRRFGFTESQLGKHALPKLLDAEDYARAQHTSYMEQEAKRQADDLLRETISTGTQELINAAIAPKVRSYSVPGSNEVISSEFVEDFTIPPWEEFVEGKTHARILGDVGAYGKLQKKVFPEIAVNLRGQIDTWIGRMKKLNPTATAGEVSRQILKQIGDMAVTWGLPELLDFADVPGKDGISVIQAYGAEVTEYRGRAHTAQMAKLKDYESVLDKQEVERVKGKKTELVINIFDAMKEGTFGNGPKLQDLRDVLSTSDDFATDPEFVGSWLKVLDTHEKAAFADEPNPETLFELDEKDVLQTLTIKEVVAAARNGKLDRPAYTRLIGSVASRMGAKGSKSETDIFTKNMLNQVFAGQVRGLETSLSPGWDVQMSRFFNVEYPKMIPYVTSLQRSYVLDLIIKAGGLEEVIRDRAKVQEILDQSNANMKSLLEQYKYLGSFKDSIQGGNTTQPKNSTALPEGTGVGRVGSDDFLFNGESR